MLFQSGSPIFCEESGRCRVAGNDVFLVGDMFSDAQQQVCALVKLVDCELVGT